MIQAIVLAALLINQTAPSGSGSELSPAPAFTLRDDKGRWVRLDDYRGKVVLLNFWATWCVPCRAEMPELVKWQKENRARGLEIIGVTFPPEKRNRVLVAIRRFRLNYKILFGTRAMVEAYGVGDVLPTTVIVDREGNVRGRILGIVGQEEFEERIEPLLRR
jgi:thiol-disulfide isomerase/thioredoxin